MVTEFDIIDYGNSLINLQNSNGNNKLVPRECNSTFLSERSVYGAIARHGCSVTLPIARHGCSVTLPAQESGVNVNLM